MGDRKPIGVAYRDQDIDGGEIGRNDPQLVRGTRLYATEELGYCSCAFGEVTQLTSKTTDVTLNTPTGRITMDDSQLNNNAVARFTMNNTSVGANDVIIVNIKLNGSTPEAYIAFVADIGEGFADLALWNRSGGQLSEAVELNFAVIRNFVE
jgi:hypothetical protein